MNLNKPADSYTDFTSLARLRVDAQKDQQAALKEVAKQFESVFVQMMIKSMRDAGVPLESGLFSSNQTKTYTEMYDKQLGLELTKSNGIGLADVIVRQLSKPQGIDQTNTELATGDVTATSISRNPSAPVHYNKAFLTDEVVETKNPFSLLNPVDVNAMPDGVHAAMNFSVDQIQQSTHWSEPADFIRDSWPHAQQAGRELGVDPRVILAQSALETGWGKNVHVDKNGENSYSLFGIKANNNWDGKRVDFDTMEYRHGKMLRERASFRAYDSVAESYRDYVDFIKQNPRYRSALESNSDNEFAVQLQKAGYATDPDYARKIERIRQGELLNRVVSELKTSSQEPLV